MTIDSFKKKFSIVALEVTKFLEWLTKVTVPTVESIFEIMNKKDDHDNKHSDK